MLYGVSTPRGTGILILGDRLDLQSLRDVIERLSVAFDAPGWEGQHQLLVAFHEVIVEGMNREQTEPKPDGLVYLGFQALWPDVLVASNLLRTAASVMPTSDLDHGMLYLFEAATKRALEAYDSQGAAILQQQVGRGINIYDPLVFQLNQALSIQYANKKATKARFRELPSFLKRYFTPGQPDYTTVTAQVRERAAADKKRAVDLRFVGMPERIIW